MSNNSIPHCTMAQYAHRIEGSMAQSAATHLRIETITKKVDQLDRIPDIVIAINRASWSNILLTAFLAVLLILKELKDSNTNFKANGFGAGVEVTNK